MRNMNRKGLADIVAVISLVFLSTIAAIMLSGFIMALINPDEQLAPQFSCIDYQADRLVQAKKACYNSATGDIEFTVQRKVSSVELPQVDFTINTEGGSKSYTSKNCANCNVLDIGDTKTYFFSWPAMALGKGEVIVRVGDCALDSVEIIGEC